MGNVYSVYWPWVIRVDDKLDNALGKYYMYYSSDHAGTTGGIDLAYANNLAGPWITYTGGTLDANYPQRIYINYNGSTRVEKETPSVLWDSNNSKFIMLFQSASSYSGEAQSSWRVESTDGITWTNKAKLFDIDVTRIQGNLHNGYVMPFEFDGIIFAYSSSIYTIKLVDTNGNYITFYSSDQAYDTSTLYTGSLNGTTVSGTVATVYNMAGDYNSCRGTSGVKVLTNQTFRIDKNRNEIAILVNDQIVGRKAITGLSAFGQSHFEFRFSSSTSDSALFSMRQIKLNIEY